MRVIDQHGDVMEAQAATWAARQNDGLDGDDTVRLHAWLAEDPRHADALTAMSATLHKVRQLPGDELARLRSGIAGYGAERAVPQKKSLRHWASMRVLPWAAGAVMAVAMISVGTVHWWQSPTFERDYATTRGQQILATLPDDDAAGSTLQLDTATQLHARLYRNRREVELRDGQAMFVVHADASRPFHVRAGDLNITVVGTRFSVRHTASGVDAGRTVVAVEEGHVRVSRADGVAKDFAAQESVVDLTAGQMLASQSGGDIGPVTSISPAAVAQWRGGRISFNQTPLAQALAEFERYGNTKLVVRDPQVAAMPVGGSYGLQQFKSFAESLPHVLPVRLVQRGDVTEVVAR